jgi:phosphoribosylglycinamide formyltransferase-1
MITTQCRLVVLISGNGSNLQSLIDQTQAKQLPATINVVISNRPNAYGLQRAIEAGIAVECVDHTAFASRAAFDQALRRSIDRYVPDLVVLAGFMRILSDDFVRAFSGRLINIHPSLLPKYPGLNTHQRALDAGDQYAGATVHFVTSELDGGPAIIQAAVPILATDTADQLAQRVLQQEHRIYPLAVRWFAQGRLRLEQGRVVLDDKYLPIGGVSYET